MHRLTIVFLSLSVVFAWIHFLAVTGSMYWYFWWFDIVMHFWGGILLALGFHTLARMKSISFRPTLGRLLLLIGVAVISWELFEWVFKIYGTDPYIVDTSIDILLGYSGGLLTHYLLQMYTIDRV